MVRAILSGSKTQTRKVVKRYSSDCVGWFDDGDGEWAQRFLGPCGSPFLKAWRDKCPFGQPGDRLWVREAWMPDPPSDGTWAYTEWAGCRTGQIVAVPERFRHPAFCNYRESWPSGADEVLWMPGIHMPRWASRITLEVTGVRVNRLHDITEKDAIAEGAPRAALGSPQDGCHTAGFADLWESINGAGSWGGANPWVWAIEFKRLEQP